MKYTVLAVRHGTIRKLGDFDSYKAAKECFCSAERKTDRNPFSRNLNGLDQFYTDIKIIKTCLKGERNE